MTSSIFVQLLLPCAESRLNSIRDLKTDENGPGVENGKQLLANEFLKNLKMNELEKKIKKHSTFIRAHKGQQAWMKKHTLRNPSSFRSCSWLFKWRTFISIPPLPPCQMGIEQILVSRLLMVKTNHFHHRPGSPEDWSGLIFHPDSRSHPHYVGYGFSTAFTPG